MTELLGTISRHPDDSTITMKRSFRTTPADLWAAIVTPDRTARWMGALSGELAAGGRYNLDFNPGDDSAKVDGTILTCVPEQELEVTWQAPGDPESLVHVRLVATDNGTDLLLTHSRLAHNSDTGHAAGWQIHLDQLAGGLEQGDWSDQWGDAWPNLQKAYAATVQS